MTRQAWHQFDPVRMYRTDYERLPFREDVEEEDYKDRARYRARAYPGDIFVWVAYPDGAETKGEWQMGATELD